MNLGTSFFGEIGMFREMPLPKDIGDYEPYLDLQYKKNIIQDNIDRGEIHKDEKKHEFQL